MQRNCHIEPVQVFGLGALERNIPMRAKPRHSSTNESGEHCVSVTPSLVNIEMPTHLKTRTAEATYVLSENKNLRHL